MHNTQIIGNVGRDAEMRYTPSGAAVTSFSVAVNEQYTSNNGEKVKNTIWYRVSVWGKLAETANQYVKKGMKIYISGKMNADPDTGGPRLWQDKSGAWKTSYEITGRDMEFLSYPDSERVSGDGEAEPGSEHSPYDENGELPF